jgi:NTP pyrophosphatase (non-canonical NTP hydrolase)
MEINEYVKLASRTKAHLWNFSGADNVHMLFGMVDEIGELVKIFKANLAYKKDIDWFNVKEEVGDLLWYIAGFCDTNGFNLEEIMELNIAKLKARYPENFREEDANNRNLEKEREILEK